MVSVVDIVQRFLMASVVGLFVNGFRRRRKRCFMVSVVFCLWFPSWQETFSCLWLPFLQQQAKAEAQGLHKIYTRSTRGLHEFYTRSAVARNVLLWLPSLFLLMVSAVARNAFVWFPSLVLFMVSGCNRTAAVSPMETVKRTPERFQDELSIYVYNISLSLYIYIYI